MNVPIAKDAPQVLTVTSTGPGALAAGVVTVMEVPNGEMLVISPGFPPNRTSWMHVRLDPVMMTVVPPETGPVIGAKPVILGRGAKYVKVPAASVESQVPTVTSTGPGALAGGDVTVIVVPCMEIFVIPPGIPPNLTSCTHDKFVPVIVTDVPPETGPLVGERPVMAGRGR